MTRYSHHLLYFTIRSRSEYSDKVQPPPAVVYHTITIWIQWQGTATTCCVLYHTITIWIQWQGTATTCCSLPYDHDLNTVTRYSHHLLYFTIRSRSEYSDKVQPPPAVVYHTITIWIQWQGTATTCCSLPYDHDLNTVTRYSHHLLYFTIRSRSEYSDKVQPPPAVVYHTITIWIQWQGTATTCCSLPYDHDLNTVTRYSHHLLYFTIRSRSEYSDKVQPPPAVVYHTITIWIQWQGTATTCCTLPYDHDLNTLTRYSHHLL